MANQQQRKKKDGKELQIISFQTTLKTLQNNMENLKRKSFWSYLAPAPFADQDGKLDYPAFFKDCNKLYNKLIPELEKDKNNRDLKKLVYDLHGLLKALENKGDQALDTAINSHVRHMDWFGAYVFFGAVFAIACIVLISIMAPYLPVIALGLMITGTMFLPFLLPAIFEVMNIVNWYRKEAIKGALSKLPKMIQELEKDMISVEQSFEIKLEQLHEQHLDGIKLNDYSNFLYDCRKFCRKLNQSKSNLDNEKVKTYKKSLDLLLKQVSTHITDEKATISPNTSLGEFAHLYLFLGFAIFIAACVIIGVTLPYVFALAAVIGTAVFATEILLAVLLPLAWPTIQIISNAINDGSRKNYDNALTDVKNTQLELDKVSENAPIESTTSEASDQSDLDLSEAARYTPIVSIQKELKGTNVERTGNNDQTEQKQVYSNTIGRPS